MAERHRIETFEAAGRQVLTWDPEDEESVRTARAEFERLRAAGFALFAVQERPGLTVETRIERFEPNAGAVVGRSAIPVQTDEFRPESTRIVAVRPIRGGSAPETRHLAAASADGAG